jgi:hypothetical protein
LQLQKKDEKIDLNEIMIMFFVYCLITGLFLYFMTKKIFFELPEAGNDLQLVSAGSPNKSHTRANVLVQGNHYMVNEKEIEKERPEECKMLNCRPLVSEIIKSEFFGSKNSSKKSLSFISSGGFNLDLLNI